MTPVKLTSRWLEILGNNRSEMPDETRRQRWEEWKALCLKAEDGEAVVKTWTDCSETCTGCMHKDKDWCRLQQLPCTVNPILTFDSNMIGMACMGAGFNQKELTQGVLF